MQWTRDSAFDCISITTGRAPLIPVVRQHIMGLEELIRSGGESIDLSTVNFTPGLLRCIPRHLALKYRALPIFEAKDCLGVATDGPPDLDVVDALTHVLQRELTFRTASGAQLDAFLQNLYGSAGGGDR